MSEQVDLSESHDGPGLPKPASKLLIVLFIFFVVLFVLNVVTWAPPVVTDPVNLGIDGKYFYLDHGVVYETTRMKCIWSWIIFPSGLALFVVVFILSIVRHVTGGVQPPSQRAQRFVKWIVAAGFLGIVTFIGMTIYKARKEWATYPNPAASASEFVLNVRGATEIFFDEHGRYATTADELVKTGHFHPSGVAFLSGENALNGYTFTYTTDGKSYECIGQPPASNPQAYVYFVSNESWCFYCLFQDTDLNDVRQGILKLEE